MSGVCEFYVNDHHPMYVERWDGPGACSSSSPRSNVILVHGGAHTGHYWARCPDGRPGWARHLADRGWRVFVVDWPGMGRSRREPDFLTAGPGPVVAALRQLLRQEGPSVIIGHSIGAAIAAKAIDGIPGLVRAFVAISPAPPGNLRRVRPLRPLNATLSFTAEEATRFFTNAERFPQDAVDTYLRSLCDYSPSIQNALSDADASGSLVIDDVAGLSAIRSLVLAGDQDQLTPGEITVPIAGFLNAEHVTAGRDWGLFGFGHMIPIEVGSERLLDRLLPWIGACP